LISIAQQQLSLSLINPIPIKTDRHACRHEDRLFTYHSNYHKYQYWFNKSFRISI